MHISLAYVWVCPLFYESYFMFWTSSCVETIVFLIIPIITTATSILVFGCWKEKHSGKWVPIFYRLSLCSCNVFFVLMPKTIKSPFKIWIWGWPLKPKYVQLWPLHRSLAAEKKSTVGNGFQFFTDYLFLLVMFFLCWCPKLLESVQDLKFSVAGQTKVQLWPLHRDVFCQFPFHWNY